MALYNPYREYDKGMEDAYFGNPMQSNDARYLEGYNRALQLEEEEHRKRVERDQEFEQNKHQCLTYFKASLP